MNKQQLIDDQIDWLNECVQGTWKYENGVVNVIGVVQLTQKGIEKIPVKFGKVTESFRCGINKLTSLENCPYEVGGIFDVCDNELTSFEYAPHKVSRYIYCSHNPFILNDKLFKDFRKFGNHYLVTDVLFRELYDQISIQFGVTNKKIIQEIWQSYMSIYNGE